MSIPIQQPSVSSTNKFKILATQMAKNQAKPQKASSIPVELTEFSFHEAKLFSERVTNRFTATDVLYAIQAICISFLKTALIYYLIAIFSSPIVLIVVVLIAVNSVFKIFKW